MKTHLVDNFSEKYGMINRTSIEDRDRCLMEKFRNIVEEKEQVRAQHNAQAPQRRPWPVFALAGLILTAGILFMVYSMTADPVITESPSTQKTAEAAVPEKSAPMAQLTPADVEQQISPKETPAEELVSEASTAPVLSVKPETQPSEVVQQHPEKAAPNETLPKIVSMPDVTVPELIICRGIKNRQYVSAENNFSMKDGAKPVVWTWMNVLTEKPPQELSHIYYLNGKKFCRVILPVPYPRTRTWSKVALKKPSYAGSWRVDVVNNSGQVIARTDFTVES
nr:DUF2914 domain-containing protein [uncultured Desulfobacter sp.]